MKNDLIDGYDKVIKVLYQAMLYFEADKMLEELRIYLRKVTVKYLLK